MNKLILFIREHKSFSVLIALMLTIILSAIFAHIIAPYDPYQGQLKDAFMPPSSEHWFGTDKLGRDIFSRVIYGVRISLTFSVILILIISSIGSSLGIIAGYCGGLVDIIIMRISDILIACPSMVLAIALAGIMGASLKNAMIAIFIVTVSKYIRLTRSLVIKIKNEEYIKAAHVSGTTHVNIIIRHIIPNIVQVLIMTVSTDVAAMILELSALSFLGFGVQAPTPELGVMINEGRAHLLNAPWLIVYPGVAIVMIVTVSNLLSDKLRDFLSKS